MKLDFEYGQGTMAAELPDNTDIFIPGETVKDPACIPEDQLAEAFSRGINKFNYGTDTMHCYNDAVLAYHKAHEPAGSNDMIGEAEFVQKAITDFLAKKLDLVKL